MKHTKKGTKKRFVLKKIMKGGAIPMTLDEFIATFERNYERLKRAGQAVALSTLIALTIAEIVQSGDLSGITQSGMNAVISTMSALSSAMTFSSGILNVTLDATGNVVTNLTSAALTTLFGLTQALGSSLQHPAAAAAFGATSAAIGTTVAIDPNLLRLRPMLATAYSLLVRMNVFTNRLAIENGQLSSQEQQQVEKGENILNEIADDLSDISSTVSSNVSSQANSPASSQGSYQGNLNFNNAPDLLLENESISSQSINHEDLQTAANIVAQTMDNDVMLQLINNIKKRTKDLDAIITNINNEVEEEVEMGDSKRRRTDTGPSDDVMGGRRRKTKKVRKTRKSRKSKKTKKSHKKRKSIKRRK